MKLQKYYKVLCFAVLLGLYCGTMLGGFCSGNQQATIGWDDARININTNSYDYLGAFSFTGDAVGAHPAGWTIQEGSNTYTHVIEFMGTHRKVVEFWDNTNTGLTTATNSFTARSTGTIEFWYYFQKGGASYDNFVCRIRSGTTIGAGISFENSNNRIYNELGAVDIALGVTANSWHHIRIDFDCSTDTYRFWLDGVNKGTFGFWNGLSTADNLFYTTSASYTYGNSYAWVDAVDYSWAPGYYLNRNWDYEAVDYLGEYSFTEDVLGTDPAGWAITEYPNTSIEVIDTLDNHHQVVRLQDDNNGQVCLMSDSFTAVSKGTIEFWIYGKEQGCTEIDLMSGAARRVVLIFYWGDHYARNWRGGGAGDQFPVPSPTLIANVWHHIRITFTSPTFNFYYDGVNKGVYNYYSSGSINQMQIWTTAINGVETGLLAYVDAIDYSWASGYYTNRNMDNIPNGGNINQPVEYLPLILIICGIIAAIGIACSIYNKYRPHNVQQRHESPQQPRQPRRSGDRSTIAPPYIDTITAPHIEAVRVPQADDYSTRIFPIPNQIDLENVMQPPISTPYLPPNILYCPNCGAKHENDQLFCAHCGSEL